MWVSHEANGKECLVPLQPCPSSHQTGVLGGISLRVLIDDRLIAGTCEFFWGVDVKVCECSFTLVKIIR